MDELQRIQAIEEEANSSEVAAEKERENIIAAAKRQAEELIKTGSATLEKKYQDKLDIQQKALTEQIEEGKRLFEKELSHVKATATKNKTKAVTFLEKKFEAILHDAP